MSFFNWTRQVDFTFFFFFNPSVCKSRGLDWWHQFMGKIIKDPSANETSRQLSTCVIVQINNNNNQITVMQSPSCTEVLVFRPFFPVDDLHGVLSLFPKMKLSSPNRGSINTPNQTAWEWRVSSGAEHLSGRCVCTARLIVRTFPARRLQGPTLASIRGRLC